MIDKYPYIYPDYIDSFFQQVVTIPKDSRLNDFLVYATEIIEDKNKYFRYFASDGWKKYNERLQKGLLNSEIDVQTTSSPQNITDVHIPKKRTVDNTQISSKEGFVNQLIHDEYPNAPKSKKVKGANYLKSIKIKRMGILLDMIEKDRILEFNNWTLKEFNQLETDVISGQHVSKETLAKLATQLQEENKLKIYVTSIRKESGLVELKTFFLHQSLSPDSEQVKQFIENYRLKQSVRYIATKYNRQVLQKVNVEQLPPTYSGPEESSGKRDDFTKETGYHATRIVAFENGWIQSRYLRAKEIHKTLLEAYLSTHQSTNDRLVTMSEFIPHITVDTLIKINGRLPYTNDEFMKFIKVKENRKLKLKDLPRTIQSIVFHSPHQVKTAISRLLDIIKSLELVEIIKNSLNQTVLKLSKYGNVRDYYSKENTVVATFALDTVKDIDVFWTELRDRCIDTLHLHGPHAMEYIDKSSPIAKITTRRSWWASDMLTKKQQEILNTYVDFEKATVPLNDIPLRAYLANQLNLPRKRIKLYFQALIKDFERKKAKPEKPVCKYKAITPSPAISQLMKISLEKRKLNVAVKQIKELKPFVQPTFIGSRQFKKHRHRYDPYLEPDVTECNVQILYNSFSKFEL